jgi:hypothetical protein
MFPILALGAVAMGGYAVTKSCAMAVFTAKSVGTAKRLEQAVARESLDVNSVFEERVERHMRKRYKTTKNPDEAKLLAAGLGDIVEVPVPVEMLPEKYKDLAGYWYVTRRDEVILWYFLIRVQAKGKVGQVGNLVKELEQKSGIPASRIDSVLFGVQHVEQGLESVVRAIREMSKNRHDSPLHRKALGWSQQ